MSDSDQIRVLYMEDDPGLARLVQRRLTRSGCDVDVASDGHEGLAMYANGSYDVVVVDQLMPGYNGLDVIRKLASQGTLPPMIMVTGRGSEKIAVEAIKLGVGDYVVKDVEGSYLDLLPTVIERVLQQSRLVEARQRAEEALRRRAAELEALVQISAALRTAEHIDEMLSIVLEQVSRVIGTPYGCIFLVEPESGDLVAQASYPPDFYPLGLRHRQDEGITGHVAKTGEIYVTEDLPGDSLSCILPEEAEIVDVWGSVISLPLSAHESVIGVMHVALNERRPFLETEKKLLTATADIAANAIRRAMVVDGLEREVADRTAEIRAEQEKSEAILRSVGEAIVVVDLEQRIQYVNDAFTKLTGYTAEEAFGRKIESLIGETITERAQLAMRRAVAQGRAWQGEIVARRKDGRTYNAAISFYPMRDADGDLVGYVSSHRDISQLKDLDRARNQFIANVSHQLRTPVTVMQLYTHLMRKKHDSENTELYLKTLEDVTDQLTHLIQDILEMAMLDSGQAVTVWAPLSLDIIVETIITRCQERAEKAGLSLEASPIPADLPGVRGDQGRITQALLEIVENAINFTPSGGRIGVVVDAVVENGRPWVTVAVEDTGPGIPLQEQKQVFERFFRGSLVEAGHIPGTGLGLSIVQEIVHAHGGRVTVESEEGKGSTFAMWLPATGGPS